MPVRFCILESICLAIKISFLDGNIITINIDDNTDMINTNAREYRSWFWRK